MKRISALAALLLACGVSATHAAGVLIAQVNFTNLAFSVSDLTPADGVDPFFEILLDNQHRNSTFIERDAPAFSNANSNTGFLISTLSSRRLSGGTVARAEVTSSSVHAAASGTTDTTYSVHSDTDVSSTGNAALIRITPGTRLTFSGNAQLFATAEGCGDCYALAVLELDFGYLGEENAATKTLVTSLASPNQSFSAPLGLSYANTSSEDQFLGLAIRAKAEISSVVPEPANGALALGGGLLALGVAQRRRQRRHGPGKNPALD